MKPNVNAAADDVRGEELIEELGDVKQETQGYWNGLYYEPSVLPWRFTP